VEASAPERAAHLLDIRLLGPFEVVVGGQPANVSGGKRQSLLGLLALRCGRVVGVDSLVEALWADDLPAASSITSLVFGLRSGRRASSRRPTATR
jgi:DNA-binding SARP family transcriptional activator